MSDKMDKSDRMDKLMEHFSNVVNSDKYDKYDRYGFDLKSRKDIYFRRIVARRKPNQPTWSSELKRYKELIAQLRDKLKD